MLAVFSYLTSVSTRPLVFRFHAFRAEKPATPGARDTSMTSIPKSKILTILSSSIKVINSA